MEQRQKYNAIVFAYQYMVAASVPVSAVAVFEGIERGILFLVICLAVGYLAVRFRMHHIRKRESSNRREKRCHLFFLVVMMVVCAMLPAQSEAYADLIPQLGFLGGFLVGVWFLTAFFLYRYAEYYREKYLTMYENPCVSAETIRRFEQNTMKAVRKRQIVFGAIALFMLVVICAIPMAEVDMAPQKKAVPRVEQKSEKSSNRTKSKKERFREVNEKQKNQSYAWEIFLRVLRIVMRVVIVLLLLLGIGLLVFFILRKVLSIEMPRYTKISRERETVTDGVDEYIPLPVTSRAGVGFPSDNNGKIRKYFYAYIRRKARGDIDPSLTPYELAEQYGVSERNPAAGEREAVAIYEKARYSGELCGLDEVEKARRGFER